MNRALLPDKGSHISPGLARTSGVSAPLGSTPSQLVHHRCKGAVGQGGCEAVSLVLSMLRTNNMSFSLSKFMDNLVPQLKCLPSVYIGGKI